MAKAATKKRILALAQSLPAAARQLQSASQHGFSRHAVVELVCSLIEQRCAETVQQLVAA
ncbi:hypothetical protein [Comamonas koreensis]|uniref:Bacteriophage protein n=1 Tax=Comamonas koreensis TaxID=160825 RepID=A0AAW4Y316_9BURK|nr:hypothetical protein [Comamonas koreensis]MCD2167509.1 hypothetical protein [Comamonas koreensis]